MDFLAVLKPKCTTILQYRMDEHGIGDLSVSARPLNMNL